MNITRGPKCLEIPTETEIHANITEPAINAIKVRLEEFKHMRFDNYALERARYLFQHNYTTPSTTLANISNFTYETRNILGKVNCDFLYLKGKETARYEENGYILRSLDNIIELANVIKQADMNLFDYQRQQRKSQNHLDRLTMDLELIEDSEYLQFSILKEGDLIC